MKPVVSTAEKNDKIHFMVAKALLLSFSAQLNNITVTPAEFYDDQDCPYRQSIRTWLCSNCRLDSWQTVAGN
jgi:hypothetical protein